MLPQPSFSANQLSLVPDAAFNLRQFQNVMAQNTTVTIAPVPQESPEACFDCYVCEDMGEYKVYCPENGIDYVPCVACADREVA